MIYKQHVVDEVTPISFGDKDSENLSADESDEGKKAFSDFSSSGEYSRE